MTLKVFAHAATYWDCWFYRLWTQYLLKQRELEGRWPLDLMLYFVIREAILESVDQLAEFPKCGGLGITALKKHRYNYRMRVGRYRVLFDHDSDIRIIEIQEVKKRDERTY